MANYIKSVPADSFQSCDVLSSDNWGNPAKGNVPSSGSCKQGGSGAITEPYWSDIDDWWYQGGHPESEAKWSGTNGSSHWAVRTFGGSSGRYLTGDMVDAIEFEEINNSTAKNGMYVLRYGIGLTNGSSLEWWDLSGPMDRPSTYGKKHTKYFNSSLMSRLKSGWFIERFIVEITTSPSGPGSSTTYTGVKNLKFRAIGHRTQNLILPVKRLRSQARETNRIGN